MSFWTPTSSAVLVVVSGALAIWGHAPSRMTVHRLFKPATLVLIIAATVTLSTPSDLVYVASLRAALWLSLLGDVFLMLDERWFIRGLVAFLLSLATYAVTFGLGAALTWNLLGYLLYPLVPALAILGWLWPSLGRYRPAVTIYVTVMTAMATLAIARAATPGVPPLSGLAGMGGALLFMTSDALVARRRFGEPAAPYAIELGTYFAAQWLFAATTFAG